MTLTPDLERATQDLARRYVYRADGRIDSFRVLAAPFGPLEGDCDDFAATALWLAAGRSMWRFWLMLATGRARIWRTRTPTGGRHAVLWVDGLGFIDNWTPDWRPETRHKLVRRRVVPEVVVKMLLGKLIR